MTESERTDHPLSVSDMVSIRLDTDTGPVMATRMPQRKELGGDVFVAFIEDPKERETGSGQPTFLRLKERDDGWVDVVDDTAAVTAKLMTLQAKSIGRFQELGRELHVRMHLSNVTDALEHGRRAAPTEAIQLRDIHGAERSRTLTVERRIVDAKLWDSLTPVEQDAMMAIEAGLRVLSAGIGFKGPSWVFTSGGGFQADSAQQKAADNVLTWQRYMLRKQLPFLVTQSIVADGASLRDIDRAYRKRKGWARACLGEGLRVFEELRAVDFYLDLATTS